MSPILRLIASCLMLAGCAASPSSADRPTGAAAERPPPVTLAQLLGPIPPPPPADPVIGWARVEFDANGFTSGEAGGYADLQTMRPLQGDPQ